MSTIEKKSMDYHKRRNSHGRLNMRSHSKDGTFDKSSKSEGKSNHHHIFSKNKNRKNSMTELETIKVDTPLKVEELPKEKNLSSYPVKLEDVETRIGEMFDEKNGYQYFEDIQNEDNVIIYDTREDKLFISERFKNDDEDELDKEVDYDKLDDITVRGKKYTPKKVIEVSGNDRKNILNKILDDIKNIDESSKIKYTNTDIVIRNGVDLYSKKEKLPEGITNVHKPIIYTHYLMELIEYIESIIYFKGKTLPTESLSGTLKRISKNEQQYRCSKKIVGRILNLYFNLPSVFTKVEFHSDGHRMRKTTISVMLKTDINSSLFEPLIINTGPRKRNLLESEKELSDIEDLKKKHSKLDIEDKYLTVPYCKHEFVNKRPYVNEPVRIMDINDLSTFFITMNELNNIINDYDRDFNLRQVEGIVSDSKNKIQHLSNINKSRRKKMNRIGGKDRKNMF